MAQKLETLDEQINYDICRNQAEIYEEAAGRGALMENFSDAYLTSRFCNQGFDQIWSLYHSTDARECMQELEREIDFPINKNDRIFNPDVAWWIGFTYRQLQMETGKSSKELAKIIPFFELCDCYGGLHTVDEEYATDMICEKHNLIKVKRAI